MPPSGPRTAEPIAVFVAFHLANELRAAGSQASDDGVDVVDCECRGGEVARAAPEQSCARQHAEQTVCADPYGQRQ
jgi:hypothetical protein